MIFKKYRIYCKLKNNKNFLCPTGPCLLYKITKYIKPKFFYKPYYIINYVVKQLLKINQLLTNRDPNYEKV